MTDAFWLLVGFGAIVAGAILTCWAIIYAAFRFMKIGEKGEFDDE